MCAVIRIAVLAVGMLALPWPARAAAEWVHVAQILSDGDKAIVVRHTGEAYLIAKGAGCIALWRKESRTVLINSPGMFLGAGSQLILPDDGQECRIWDVEALGSWQRPLAATALRSPAPPAQQSAEAAIQRALNALGYNAGPADGILGRQTESALRAFQHAEGLPETGVADPPTVDMLVARIRAKGPSLSRPQTVPRTASTGCETGHWVTQVLGSGAFVQLEDGSVWQIDDIDHIDTILWLPTEDILVCGAELINTDTSDRVSATRVR
jgi:hypothetical protein